MAKRYTVEFNAKVTPIKPLNDEFTLCKCYVMALDKNRNLSYISKEAAENALSTLYNIPVIGHLYVDEEGKYHMGGHDMTIVQNDDGQYEFKSICVPYGVVPQQDNIHYEDIEEPNGDIHTYIVSDVILWTGRFPELYDAIYNEKTYFGQSMEINVNNYEALEEDKNYTNILEYSYSALCLLGKSDNPDEHVEPCFPMARIEPYEFSVEDDKFSELMFELKQEIASCFDNSNEKKGQGMENTKESVSNQAGSVVEENVVNNDTTDNKEDEFQQQASVTDESNDNAVNDDESTEGDTAENHSDDTANETTVECSHEAHNAFSSTYEEKRSSISKALPEVANYNENDELVYYMYCYISDFDDVNVYVIREEWSANDGYSMKRGKYSYEYSEDTKETKVNDDFVEMFEKWLTKEELDSIDEMRKEYDVLVEYKAHREEEDKKAEYDAAISEFAYLSDNEDYKTVYENRYAFKDVEELRNACYIIKGKYSISTPQLRKNNAEPVIPVDSGAVIASLHERFHERFGRK